MFGYLIPDTKSMYDRDFKGYKAFYCGLCHTIKKHNGRLIKYGITYDATFINILMHSVYSQQVTYSYCRCLKHPLKCSKIINSNKLSQKIANLNTLLIDFKLRDNLKDEPNFKTKIAYRFLKKSIRKSKKQEPEIANIIDYALYEQKLIEDMNCDSIDIAAHSSANALKNIIKILLKDNYRSEIGDFIYQLARFIYIADALDDYDDDLNNNCYNTFKYIYNSKSKKELIEKNKKDIEFMLYSSYYLINNMYRELNFNLYNNLIEHIIKIGIYRTIKIVIGEINE